VPGPDGRVIYTGNRGLLTETLRKQPSAAGGGGQPVYGHVPCFPSSIPGYYLTLPIQSVAPQRGGPGGVGGNGPTGSVWLAGNDRPLLSLPPLPEMASDPNQQNLIAGDFTLDKRVHFMPNANVLITIPYSNDGLVIRKFDVGQELDRSGIDYLFVTSAPVTEAVKGETYRYAITAKSKRGSVRFKLESGPEGMTVSDKGEVTWAVPADAESREDVIITVSDASGQETFHTYAVVPTEAPFAAAERPGAK
jgi:hypothetical protein